MFASAAMLTRTVVLVTGGRDYRHRAKLWRFLDRVRRDYNLVLLVAGECPTGTDLFAKQWAEARGIAYRGYPADWTNMDARPCIKRYRADGECYNAAAGGVRNGYMLTHSGANLVVATAGRSGTQDMRKRAKRAGVTILDVDYSTE